MCFWACAPAIPVQPDFTTLEATEQRPGDPDAGYFRLLNDGYVTCGIPASAYFAVLGEAPAARRLPGRVGNNARLSYDRTATLGKTGREIIAPNCLTCHAATLGGQLIVGLGNTTRDFTLDETPTVAFVGRLLSNAQDIAEHQKFLGRTRVISPRTITKTIGVNPADTLAAVIFAHRDPDTLTWSDPALMQEPPHVIPTDVPAWWLMRRKNAMFYAGGGTGDHARLMMSASTLCIDGLEDARAIDATFNDVRAYIAQLQAPPYPLTIDVMLADKGAPIYANHCASCHGTKADYPNLLVAVSVVRTDSALASSGFDSQHLYEDWFNRSFWGETAQLKSSHGYVAPPLDGVWATAPYLHNGSVPTLEALLDSSRRPRFWKRSFADDEYDVAKVGVKFTEVGAGHSRGADVTVYDTTELGYSNVGHTFADMLSDGERRALIEHLKTW